MTIVYIFEGFKNTVFRFQKVLKEKNSLLKQYKKNEISYQDMSKTLEVLNEIFLQASLDLVKVRLQHLDNIFQTLNQEMTPYFFYKNKPVLDYSYLISKKICCPFKRRISYPLF